MSTATAHFPSTSISSPRALVRRLLASDGGTPALVARVVLGAVMLPHGAQKLLGWFGGYGFSATMSYFTGAMHIPAPLAFLAILAESVGALLLVLGVAGRLGALAIGINMIVATLTSHLSFGFFMNWFGNRAGEGFEYHLLAVGLAAVVVLRGSGRWSVDRMLARRLA